ncbi:hypothetical protein ACFPOI_33575 [Nonomuraea angiospora]|uniref:Cyanate permease n=1 Tax=Nonomuraea angiospora TaxID=46172 RepID=A0ABR9LSZ1_9ACTN|nr:hypothetical protein [Nonomuraea angiospora]MBE1583769.1 cyanate permease [Nonomuraea angiospora]
MLSAGYPLGPAIGALLALSVGGTLGSWATAAAGDRFGHRATVVASFLLVAASFPTRPAGALGWSLGVGRTGAILGPLVVGVLMDAQASYTWNFYLFAGCATLGAVAALLVPRALGDGTGQLTDARRSSRAQ